MVHIDVQDNGPGIPEELQELIFRRRFRGRADGSTGLGLGLYLSRMIVTRLGGSIGVQSRPGEGATFTLSLPAADDTAG